MRKKDIRSQAAGSIFYDDDVMDGNDYAYRVYPVTVKGTQGEASNTAVITWKQPPGPPGPVKAEESDSRVEISWTKQEGISL